MTLNGPSTCSAERDGREETNSPAEAEEYGHGRRLIFRTVPDFREAIIF